MDSYHRSVDEAELAQWLGASRVAGQNPVSALEGQGTDFEIRGQHGDVRERR